MHEVELQNDGFQIAIAAVRVDGRLAVIAVPGDKAAAAQGDAVGAVDDQPRSILVIIRTVEGVPLVGAVRVEAQQGDIIPTAVGM